MLHWFSRFVAASTVLLVLAGSFVTSTGSGLSVPDWPTSYGWNMFTVPPSKWVGGFSLERGHRPIDSLHVVGSALVLTTSPMLTRRSWRGRFAVESPVRAASGPSLSTPFGAGAPATTGARA